MHKQSLAAVLLSQAQAMQVSLDAIKAFSMPHNPRFIHNPRNNKRTKPSK